MNFNDLLEPSWMSFPIILLALTVIVIAIWTEPYIR